MTFFEYCLKTLCLLLFLLLQDVGYSRQLILPLLGLLEASSEESDEMGPLPLTHRVSAHVLGWSSAVSQRRSSVQDARRVVDVYFVMVFVSDCLDIWTWESYLKHFLNVSLTQAYLTVLRILQQTLLFF